MITKIVMLAFVAACGIASTSSVPPSDQGEVDPGEDDENLAPDGQHFCCETLGNGSGDNCTQISHPQTVACKKVLYCAGSYMNDEGHVTCLD